MGRQQGGRISVEKAPQGKREDGLDEEVGVCLEQKYDDVFDFVFFAIFGHECFW
jgi:hypothetical protein